MNASELVKEVNEPPKPWAVPRLRELWERRELLYFLGRRDVAVRYKQTAVGVTWVILQPILLALIFSVFLGLLTRNIPTNGIPYPLFALAGMTMWLFFSNAMSRSAESTVSNVELVSKVYFPRLAIPLAAIAQPAVDFIFSFCVLVLVMFIYGVVPDPRIVLIPVVFVLACVIAVGIGLWLSALVVRYRDVRHIVPFLVQTLIFVTPVVYPLSLIPKEAQPIYALNPLVGVFETFRWILFPGSPSPGWLLLISVVAGALLVLGGLFYFQRAEAEFADVI
jgi:lipopolysaccharide transport system permease protein